VQDESTLGKEAGSRAQQILAVLPGEKYRQTYTGDTLTYTVYTKEALEADIAKGVLTPEQLIPLYCQATPVSGPGSGQTAAVAALASKKAPTAETSKPKQPLTPINYAGTRGIVRTEGLSPRAAFTPREVRQRGGTRRRKPRNTKTKKRAKI
jgi:hypothetical protein